MSSAVCQRLSRFCIKACGFFVICSFIFLDYFLISKLGNQNIKNTTFILVYYRLFIYCILLIKSNIYMHIMHGPKRCT